MLPRRSSGSFQGNKSNEVLGATEIIGADLVVIHHDAKLLFDGDVQTAIQKVRQRTRMTVMVGDGRNPEAKQLLQNETSIDEIEHKTQDDFLLVTLREGVQDGSQQLERMIDVPSR